MMTSANIPSFEEELNCLRPILPLLCEAIEYALGLTRQHFEDRGTAVDTDLAPHLVRYYAKQFLLEHRHLVDGLEVVDVPNNGLSIRYAGGALRVWKGDDVSLPLPGHSRRKLNFLNQQLGFSFGDQPEPPAPLNKMLLWSVDSEYELVTLYLSLPAGARLSPQSSYAYWTEPIPLTAMLETEARRTHAPRRDDRLDLEPLEDDSDQVEAT